ncbi:MAG: hypothetical protein SGARI_001814 [Bacillariaceae sp.]
MVPASTNFSLDITNMNKEQLAGRLVTYQQFMSRYIVEAQEQKRKAVLAAEAAVTAKYEQKLQLYQSKAQDAPAPPAIKAPATQLYEGRNANVAAAAKAGKSRWGDAEVKKASGAAVNGVPVNGAANNVPVVEKPDPNSIAILTGSSLYYHRNQMVAAAGAAGKSRWGDQEVKKAATEASKGPPSLEGAAPVSSSPAIETTTASAAPIEVTPEIEAADHGLRNDGGVGGPSLAERVNLGASLLGGESAPPAINGASASPSAYDLRNARVAAAAAAGKSRWGTMENEKASNLSSNALPSAPPAAVAAAVVTTPEVEAADHGLRADGGVGGPSLAQRVNLGASLLGP